MNAEPDQKKDPLYGEPDKPETLYGEDRDVPDVSDPEAAVKEGQERARESGEKAQESTGGGGQEGI